MELRREVGTTNGEKERGTTWGETNQKIRGEKKREREEDPSSILHHLIDGLPRATRADT